MPNNDYQQTAHNKNRESFFKQKSCIVSQDKPLITQQIILHPNDHKLSKPSKQMTTTDVYSTRTRINIFVLNWTTNLQLLYKHTNFLKKQNES